MITEEKKEYVEGVELKNHAVWITKEGEKQWSIETTELLDFDDGSKGTHLKSNYEVYDFEHPSEALSTVLGFFYLCTYPQYWVLGVTYCVWASLHIHFALEWDFYHKF